MPEYENGKQTREKILEAARTLFWENGYDETRYEDFRARYGINTGLLHYHFKKKDAMALEIYKSFIADANDALQTLAADRDPLVPFVLMFRLMWSCFDHSLEFARFVRECIPAHVHSEAITAPAVHFAHVLNESFGLGLSDLECRIRTYALVGGQLEFIHAYLSGNLPISADECAHYDVLNALHVLDVPEAAIQKALNETNRIMEKHSFTMGPCFRLQME